MLEESLLEAIGRATATLELVDTLQGSGAMSADAAANLRDHAEGLEDWLIEIHQEVERATIVETDDRSVVID